MTETPKHRIVIKIGTNLLATPEGHLDLAFMAKIAGQLSTVLKSGKQELIIVTSGAITCGAEKLGLPTETVPQQQAAAAIGQYLLMKNYDTCFGQYGFSVAQLLVTKMGLQDAKRATHTRNTLNTLFSEGIIPIINENDSVSPDEIEDTFSDNDQLALLVTKLIDADQLILLTDIDGLHTKNPKKHPDAERIPIIESVTDDMLNMVDDSGGLTRSRGGMKSKLSVAKSAAEMGIPVIIASGRSPTVIEDIFSGKSVGTRFLAQG